MALGFIERGTIILVHLIFVRSRIDNSSSAPLSLNAKLRLIAPSRAHHADIAKTWRTKGTIAQSQPIPRRSRTSLRFIFGVGHRTPKMVLYHSNEPAYRHYPVQKKSLLSCLPCLPFLHKEACVTMTHAHEVCKFLSCNDRIEGKSLQFRMSE